MRALALAALLILGSAEAGLDRRGDRELADAVEMRLETSSYFALADVRVSVREGVVSLRGSLRTLAEVAEAERLAGRIHGVLGVDNRLRLEARHRSRSAVASLVRRAFEDNLALDAAAITVDVSNSGNVILEGEVEDARLRLTAERTASRIEGVRSIENRIVTPEVDDETIEGAVRGRIATENVVGLPGEFDVRVEDGVVTLLGRVPRPYERTHAAELALGVNGVRAVDNRLVVEPRELDIRVVRPR